MRKQSFICAGRNFPGRGSEVNLGRACKGGRRLGGSGGRAPPRLFLGRRRGYQFFLKSNERFTIYDNFNGKFCYYLKIFLKFYLIFSENFGKKLQSQNQWKTAISDNFIGNFAIFQQIVKFFRIFGENLVKNLGHFETMHFSGDRAGAPSRQASEIF